jgi:hypothetical protein
MFLQTRAVKHGYHTARVKNSCESTKTVERPYPARADRFLSLQDTHVLPIAGPTRQADGASATIDGQASVFYRMA